MERIQLLYFKYKERNLTFWKHRRHQKPKLVDPTIHYLTSRSRAIANQPAWTPPSKLQLWSSNPNLNPTNTLSSPLHKPFIVSNPLLVTQIPNPILGTLIPNSDTTTNFRCRTLLCAAVPDSRSLYEVVRVTRIASQGEIKTAYRTLAKVYHPDATSRFMDSSIASSSLMDGAARDFMEIRDAYSTLSDPDARAVYDFNLNVHRRNAAGVSGLWNPRMSYPTRRWETDQCW